MFAVQVKTEDVAGWRVHARFPSKRQAIHNAPKRRYRYTQVASGTRIVWASLDGVGHDIVRPRRVVSAARRAEITSRIHQKVCVKCGEFEALLGGTWCRWCIQARKAGYAGEERARALALLMKPAYVAPERPTRRCWVDGKWVEFEVKWDGR